MTQIPLQRGALVLAEHVPSDYFRDTGVPEVHTERLLMLDTEYADGGRGMKVVFQGRDSAMSKPATFETGSFLDGQGENGEVIKHDICVSTAGGCTRACRMCSVPSATLGFERLLTADEIITQVIYTALLRNPEHALPNVVGMMGNGEPPDNRALKPALLAMDRLLGPRNERLVGSVTISTIGENIRGIDELAALAARLAVQTKLQFSLHAADEQIRRAIIPGRASQDKILTAMDRWTEKTGEPVKYNVVLMEGTGDSKGLTNATPDDARKLAALLLAPSKLDGTAVVRRLKLSAFNPIPGIDFAAPDEETRAKFVETLRAEGIEQIKTFKGSGIEIDAQNATGGFACGQLRRTTGIRLERVSVTQGV